MGKVEEWWGREVGKVRECWSWKVGKVGDWWDRKVGEVGEWWRGKVGGSWFCSRVNGSGSVQCFFFLFLMLIKGAKRQDGFKT